MEFKQYDTLGKIAWLWMNSPLHREWSVELLALFVLPPAALGQYILIERAGIPVAYCSWAFLSEEAEAEYVLNASHMSPESWHSGSNLWFVDWVAPFQAGDSREMKNRLKSKFPSEVARAIRVKRDKATARVMEFRGSGIEQPEARRMLDAQFGKLVRILKRRPQDPRDRDL